MNVGQSRKINKVWYQIDVAQVQEMKIPNYCRLTQFHSSTSNSGKGQIGSYPCKNFIQSHTEIKLKKKERYWREEKVKHSFIQSHIGKERI